MLYEIIARVKASASGNICRHNWTQIKNILNHFPPNIFVVVFASQSANVQVAMMSFFQSDIHLGGGKHYSHFR